MLDGELEDLSASGAFLATGKRHLGNAREGAIEVTLPNGTVSVPVTVVRINDKGIGLRFLGPVAARLPLANFMVERVSRLLH